MKHYLIDSENVGDFWIPLLDLPADQAELIVFYTKNSPHMSYDSLIKLKESDRTVTFIKCYEGTNALDFQLCSELGFLIAGNEGDDFIIVTNDTGYDAAVKYWRHKEYSVKRIAGKDSRTGGRRRGTPARFDVAAEVNAILHKLARTAEPVFEENEEDLAELEQDPDLTTEVAADEEAGFENAPEDEAAIPEEEVNGADEEEFFEDEEPQEEETPEEDSEDEPFGEETEAEEEPGLEDSADAYELTESVETDPEEEGSDDTAPEGTEEEGAEPADSDAEEETEELPEPADLPQEESGGSEAEDAGSLEAPEDGQSEEEEVFIPDPEEITAIVNCIGMDNLAELHNQLIQFYGDNGKDIYQSLKSGTSVIEKQDWTREEKFLYYCALILRHSDESAEALEEENIREFAQFLLGAENKRKNLNSLRYALLKHYGKEKGRRYYFMLKPYVKALNQM